MIESYATVWEAVADATPDAPALVQGEHRVSWRELDDRAARLAGALTRLGVGHGTHVAMYLHNCAEFAETLFACLKLRAVAPSVNFRYGPTEVAHLVDDADAEMVMYHRALGANLAAALPSLPRVRAVVEVDDGSDAPSIPNALRYEDLLLAAPPAPRIERSGHDHLLWYTGGTTGLPKGVLWEQGTLLRHGLAYGAALFGDDPPATVAEAAAAAHLRATAGSSPVTLLTTPLVHASAANQLHTTLALGGAVVMLATGRVDGDDVCRTIERERVTVLSVVGDTVLRRVVDALRAADERGEPYDVSSLRRVHSSGAMASVESKDALHRHSELTFYDSLGASEAVGFGVSLTASAGEAATARFRLGLNARVLDADDHDVAPGSGEAGVLAVTESTGVAYYDDDALSARTFRDVGGARYAVLGDWAVPHADGTITLLGRGSGCITSGGEKVWAEEVEEALKTHPAVLDALVVGVPDEQWGEAVAAAVAVSTGERPSADELGEWVTARLASYKRPRHIVFVDEVARTAVGKPDYDWARARLTD